VPARPDVSSCARNGTRGVGPLPRQAKQASCKMLHARSVLFVERIDHSVIAIIVCLQYWTTSLVVLGLVRWESFKLSWCAKSPSETT
jgi:hypothetical protein